MQERLGKEKERKGEEEVAPSAAFARKKEAFLSICAGPSTELAGLSFSLLLGFILVLFYG